MAAPSGPWITPELASAITDSALDALEATRQELVSRLRAKALPTSLPHSRMVVIERDDGGSEGTYEQVAVSSLYSPEVQRQVGDDTVPEVSLGFREQLEPLAKLLASETTLDQRPAFFYPAMSGANAILVRYLCPMVESYLIELADVAQ